MSTWKLLASAICLAAAPAVAPAVQSTGEGAAPAPVDLGTQQAAAQETPPAAEADAEQLKQEELDQMLAPLALYPDSLLTQILMASTYPVEIVQADRWVQAHKDQKGDALAKELEKQTWDPSVKSLANFPDVLAALSEKLDWTAKIGDAFLTDQKAVMDTIQKLRQKAVEAGNLKSTEEQTVTTEAAPAGYATKTVIVIESADPQVVYVPVYDPFVVYGTWWYPWYPPPYYYHPLVFWPFIGFACGVPWGYAWGHCDWDHSHIVIDIDQNIYLNPHIDRSKYKSALTGGVASASGKGTWQHDASHRKGQAYPDSATAKKYGGASRTQAAQLRESYRGRSTGGQARPSDRAAEAARPSDRAAEAARAAEDAEAARAARSRASSGTPAQRPASDRPPQTGTLGRTGAAGTSARGSAFQGGDRSGGDVRRQSSRGASSRGGAARPGAGGRRGGG